MKKVTSGNKESTGDKYPLTRKAKEILFGGGNRVNDPAQHQHEFGGNARVPVGQLQLVKSGQRLEAVRFFPRQQYLTDKLAELYGLSGEDRKVFIRKLRCAMQNAQLVWCHRGVSSEKGSSLAKAVEALRKIDRMAEIGEPGISKVARNAIAELTGAA